MPDAPLLLWFRRDLRLADLPMLAATAGAGRTVIPVFLLDPVTEALGAAAKWRLGLAVESLAATLAAKGSRLVLRRGPARAVLERLVDETGASGVHWTRAYDPEAQARDTEIKAALKARGLEATSHPGPLLHEPFDLATATGTPFRVYSAFRRAAEARQVPPPLPAPDRLPAPAVWPDSERLEDWAMGAALRRGAPVLARHVRPGEAAAAARLGQFLSGPVGDYATARDRLDVEGTSRLSEHLAWGEIGPRTAWHGAGAAGDLGARGAGSFRRELLWREFAWHLLFHFPDLSRRNWRPDWEGFPWRPDNAEAEAWRRGMTGEPLVDAGMRELYVTGTMHNRARMVVASYLTKHLLTDWRVGLRWFEDCLIDWDPASNAMGWQWVAGSGPDAAPYFRIFNPATQAATHDPRGAYVRRWVAELAGGPGREALDFFDAVPKVWDLRPDRPYPGRMVDLAEGRARALAAYGDRDGRTTGD